MSVLEKLIKYYNLPKDTDLYDVYNEYYAEYDNKREKIQTNVLGRTRKLVATNVNTMEECDMDNFLDEMGDVYFVELIWENRHNEPQAYKMWNEYADLYIYATDEEIKAFTDALKERSDLTEDWFGHLYKLQEYN